MGLFGLWHNELANHKSPLACDFVSEYCTPNHAIMLVFSMWLFIKFINYTMFFFLRNDYVRNESINIDHVLSTYIKF